MTANKVDGLIAQAKRDKDNIGAARIKYRDTQNALRGLRDTHTLVGDVLSDEQLAAINEIAPPRKARAEK